MAVERGMDFEPAPMIDALPGLTRLVEGVATLLRMPFMAAVVSGLRP
jgi:hypothetical protein